MPNQNYYYQQGPNGYSYMYGGNGGWGGMNLMGTGGFFDNIGQSFNAVFSRPGRNYAFRPRNRFYQFQMYPNNNYGGQQQQQEEEARGLSQD